ncbi:hypothetical protein BaOVIS_013470 [Babesia ovis]|uniref:Uncharacterized protein n=1 Tax=Babesia ovis TaxID=5869 RepID=A0A9W5TC07_BABOV|nr:hypothetical protein BaOVIS_013470 [Babesia ovis]
MESFNKKRFLQCFDELADHDAGRRNQAVDQLLTYLALSPSVTDDIDGGKEQTNGYKHGANEKYKDPLSSQRSYKFRFVVKEHISLQYTIDRLLKGLKANRKCSRTGFTVALLSVLSHHGNNIQWPILLEATLDYTSTKDTAASEVKDVLCGRLYALFILQKSGVFCTNITTTLERVFQSIWEVYDSKIYFQDAACVLLWLLCRDVFRTTKDVDLTLRYVTKRLSLVLDGNYVESTFKSGTDTITTSMRNGQGNAKSQIGKTLTGVLPCALLGLYLRLYSDISSNNKKLLSGTVLERCPLDEEYFIMVLRYVSCTPSNHPVVGSYFDVLIDTILKSDHVEDRLQQLWRSINFTMLDLQSGSTVQRTFTGLRLSSILLLKVRNSPSLLKLFFTSGGNLFLTLCRYHNGPKGDVMKLMADNMIQLLVSTLNGAAANKIDHTDKMANPVINDFLVYTNIHQIFEGGTALQSMDSTFHRKESSDETTKPEKLDSTTKPSVPDYASPPLSANVVVECLEAVANAVDYSALSLAVLQNVFKALIRNSTDITATYDKIESIIVNIDISSDTKKFSWLLSMLQVCVIAASRKTRMELLKRFITMNTFCVSDAGYSSSNIYITLAHLRHDGHDLRVLYVSNNAVNGANSMSHVTENPVNSVTKEMAPTKLASLSKQMLAHCFSSLSKTLQSLGCKKADEKKCEVLKDADITALLGIIETVYHVLDTVIMRKPSVKLCDGSNTGFPMVELHSCKSQKPSKVKTEEHASELVSISQRLMRYAMKTSKKSAKDGTVSLIALYSGTLALCLSLLGWNKEHLSILSLSTLSPSMVQPLISGNSIGVVTSFAESFIEAFSENKASEDSILTKLLSDSLLETILSDDNSAAFGLVHSISKGLWNMAQRFINEEILNELLDNSLIQDEVLGLNEFDDDEETDSDTEDDDDKDDSEDGDDEDSDGDTDEVSTDTDQEDDSETHDNMHTDKKQKTNISTKQDEESDLELSGTAALDELLKDEEGNLEALRLERLKQRSLFHFSPEALKLMMRNLDLLQSCIPHCPLDTWYLQMVMRLYISCQKAVNVYASNKTDGPLHCVVGEYASKIKKVLFDALRHVSSHTNDQSTKEAENPSHVSTRKLEPSTIETMLQSLLDLSLEAVNGQRSEFAKEYRPQALAVFIFAMQTETMINKGNAAIQTMMVLLAALCAVSMFKNTKLGTNFFVQLSQRYPSGFTRINIVQLALESKVAFVQSELLSICAAAVTASTRDSNAKPTRFCRRKCGKVMEAAIADGRIFGETTPDKKHIVSFVTDNLLSSTLQSLPDLFAHLKASSEATTISNDTNDSGKRPLKQRGISPQLSKCTGRLTSVVVRSAPDDPKTKAQLQRVKTSLQALLDSLGESKGCNTSIQPLKSAMSQLRSALGE